MIDFIPWLTSWLDPSTLQTVILVSLFWIAAIVAILALVGSNGKDELHPVTQEHANKHVPLEDAYLVQKEVRRVKAITS